jgi:hypothetical protein
VDRSTTVASFANIRKYDAEIVFRLDLLHLLLLLLLLGILALRALLRLGGTVLDNSMMRVQMQDRGFRLQDVATVAQDSVTVVPVTLLKCMLAAW